MTVNSAAMFNPMKNLFMPQMGNYSGYLGTPGSFVTGCSPMAVPSFNPAFGGGFGTGVQYNPFQAKAESLTINRAIRNIDKSFADNEVDRVIDDFENLSSIYRQSAEYKMLTRGQAVDDAMIREMVADKYRTVTGNDLGNQIDENVRGNFFAGLWNGMTLGIGQFKSNEDLKEELLGENKSTSGKIAKTIGSVAGGAAAGAAIGSVIPGVGTAIGAGVGAVCGLISRLWS